MIWAMLFLGIGIGCALTQYLITLALGRFPQSFCDYCEWQRKVKKPFQKK